MVGFEPTMAFTMLVFKTSALNHSATLPFVDLHIIWEVWGSVNPPRSSADDRNGQRKWLDLNQRMPIIKHRRFSKPLH